MYNNSLCKYVVKTFPDGLYSQRSNFLDDLARKRLPRRPGGLTVLVTYQQSFGKVKIPQLIAVYWILLEKIKQVGFCYIYLMLWREVTGQKSLLTINSSMALSTPVLSECSWGHLNLNILLWELGLPVSWSQYRSKRGLPNTHTFVKFKLNPTSVVQVRAPATTPYVHLCPTGKNLQRWCVDMGMGLVGPALHLPLPPPPQLIFGPVRGRAPYYLGKWMSGAPTLNL